MVGMVEVEEVDDIISSNLPGEMAQTEKVLSVVKST